MPTCDESVKRLDRPPELLSPMHGRRSVGGQGDMSPLLFEVEGTPYVLSPPYFFWEQTLFVLHSNDCRRSDSAKTVTRIG